MTVLSLRSHLRSHHPLVHSKRKCEHRCFLVGEEVHRTLLAAARKPPAAWSFAVVKGDLSCHRRRVSFVLLTKALMMTTFLVPHRCFLDHAVGCWAKLVFWGLAEPLSVLHSTTRTLLMIGWNFSNLTHEERLLSSVNGDWCQAAKTDSHRNFAGACESSNIWVCRVWRYAFLQALSYSLSSLVHRCEWKGSEVCLRWAQILRLGPWCSTSLEALAQ